MPFGGVHSQIRACRTVGRERSSSDYRALRRRPLASSKLGIGRTLVTLAFVQQGDWPAPRPARGPQPRLPRKTLRPRRRISSKPEPKAPILGFRGASLHPSRTAGLETAQTQLRRRWGGLPPGREACWPDAEDGEIWHGIDPKVGQRLTEFDRELTEFGQLRSALARISQVGAHVGQLLSGSGATSAEIGQTVCLGSNNFRPLPTDSGQLRPNLALRRPKLSRFRILMPRVAADSKDARGQSCVRAQELKFCTPIGNFTLSRMTRRCLPTPERIRPIRFPPVRGKCGQF